MRAKLAANSDRRRWLVLTVTVAAQFLSGIGLALSFVPVTIASLTGVQPADAGVASGLINTSRQIGGSVGLVAVTTIAATATSHTPTATRRAPLAARRSRTGSRSPSTRGSASRSSERRSLPPSSSPSRRKLRRS
jgi:hypothetical protein